jgi:hypothetical protein
MTAASHIGPRSRVRHLICGCGPACAGRASRGRARRLRGASGAACSALISYTAKFGSGSDPDQIRGLLKAASREADGL